MSRNGVYLDLRYGLHYPPGSSLVDTLPDELKAVTHVHWDIFPPQHPFIVHSLSIFYLLLWVVSFCGNLLVISVFLSTKGLRTPSNIFVINLAMSDIVMSTTHNLPMAVTAFARNQWIYGILACQLSAMLGGLCGTTSLLSMVVIGFDRYNVIVRGFNGIQMTVKKALFIVISIWTYSLVVSAPPFIGWGQYALEGTKVTCAYDYLSEDWNSKSFILYALVFNFSVPMTFILYFYIQIVRAVFHHERALRAQAKKMNVESLRSNQDSKKESAEVKVAKVAITNVVLWFFGWAPYAVIVIFGLTGQHYLINPISCLIPSTMTKFACCVTPVVFAFSHPKYREALAEKYPCLGIGEKRQDLDSSKMTTVNSGA